MYRRVTRLLARVAAVVALVTLALWPARSGAAAPAPTGAEAAAVHVWASVVALDEVREAPAAPAHDDGDASLGGEPTGEDDDDAQDRALPPPAAAAVAGRPATRRAHAAWADERPPLVHLELTTPPPER